MAAVGFTAIQLYYSTTASAAPTAPNLAAGELALNTLDEKLYFKNSAGAIKLLASVASTAFNPLAPGPIGFTTPNTGSFTTLSASGSVTATSLLLSNGNTVNWGGAGSSMYLDGSAATNSWEVVTGSAQRVLVNNTGLAVTGALSVTNAIISTGGYLGSRLDGSDSVGAGPVISITNAAANRIWLDQLSVSNNKDTWYFNGSAWAKQATLDTAGNLGLGVVPSAWVTYKACQIGNASLSNYSGSGDTNLGMNCYYDGVWRYHTSSITASRFTQNGGAHTWYTAPSGTAGTAITFTQAMTLDASGNLYVNGNGFTTADGSIALNKASAASIAIAHANGAITGSAYEYYTYNGSVIGSIVQSGTTAVIYQTTSDHRLKTNVRDANAARFMDIQFRDFEWVDGRHDCGVIAHELQAVYPDLVMGAMDATEVRTVEITPAVPAVLDAEGVEVTPEVVAVTEDQTFPVYQQVNYMGLIGRMGTVIQHQQRAIDALAARLTALEAA